MGKKAVAIIWLLVQVHLVLSVSACRKPNDRAQEETRIREARRADSVAIIQGQAFANARRGDIGGILKLYEIATNDQTYSVEGSDVAIEELHHLYVHRTGDWVRAFASLPDSALQEAKRYFSRSPIVRCVFVDDSLSQTEYVTKAMKHLGEVKGNEREQSFAEFLRRLIVNSPCGVANVMPQ